MKPIRPLSLLLATLTGILLPTGVLGVTDDADYLIVGAGEVYTLGGTHEYNIAVQIAAAGSLLVAAYDGNANTGYVELIAPSIDMAGTIHGDGRGYRRQEGPGGSTTYPGAGGGYGGAGGASGWGNPGGAPYGTASGIDGERGSGGGNTSSGNVGGAGGALIALRAPDLSITGTITANGNPGLSGPMDGGGGGSGGCILIDGDHVVLFATLRVDGGPGGDNAQPTRRCGGGGGGGRIKIFPCDLDYGIMYSMNGGAGGTGGSYPGAAGSPGTYANVSLPEPAIDSIVDVPGDQGGQVRIRWARSCPDDPSAPDPVTHYDIWRRIEGSARASGPTPLRLAYPPGDWDFVATVPARGEDFYHYVVPTLADSNGTGVHLTTLFVSGVTANPFVYYDSPPDSGYSVDNLAPAVPANLRLDVTTLLWDECPDADFCFFTAYGSATNDLGSAVFLGNVTDPTMAVQSSPFAWYLVTATDFAGNEGEAAAVPNTVTAAGLDALRPSAFGLRVPSPNPFDARTTIVFEMPHPAHATLRIYDVAGRLVRTLRDGDVPAGRHAPVWNGLDERGAAASPGVYFVRFASEDYTATRKLVRRN